MQCDMCGSNQGLVKAKIEGTVMDVCKTCARFGEIVRVPRSIPRSHKSRPIKQSLPQKIEIIVPNYSVLIKQAREKRQMKQEDVAKKLSEKESIYHKIENGSFRPSIKLAKKLEAFFKIKLIEIHEDKMKPAVASAPINKNAMTIGDMIKKR